MTPETIQTRYVIALTGRNGSGKDTAAEYLRDAYGYAIYSTGEVVRQMARKRGEALTRDSLHDISREMIEEYGREVFVKTLLDQVRQNGVDRAAFVGIRMPQEVAYLRERLGDRFLLATVYDGDPQTRYRRTQDRGEPRDRQSFEEFKQQDEREDEMFGIERTIAMADVNLDNGGSLDELRADIDDSIPDEVLGTGVAKETGES